ncbi:MAG: sulfotransferase [Gammaproteobacteria bacterium]
MSNNTPGNTDQPAFVHQPSNQLEELFRRAQTHEKAGRLGEAEKLLRQILSLHPQQPVALHQLGIIAHKVGRNDIAVDLVTQAVAAAPQALRFVANLTELARLTGDLDKALSAGLRAIELDPDSAGAHSNLGIVYYDRKDYESAEQHQRRALALAPDLPSALNNLGSICRVQNDFESALEFYRRAHECDPDNPEPLNNLGSVSILAEQPEAGVQHLQHALRLRPGYADAMCNLGFALSALDRHEEAFELFRQSLAIRPAYPEAQQGLARELVDRNELEEALKAAESAANLAPDNAEILATLGQVHSRLNHFDPAQTAYDAALSIAPDLANALLGKGVLYMEAGRIDEADELFAATLTTGRETLPARYYLTQVKKVHAGDPNVAALETALNEAETLGSRKSTYIHFALGKAYEDQADYELAFPHFAEGYRLRRESHGYDAEERYAVFDGIMRDFNHGKLDSLKGAGNEDPLPIFVLGMPRSGTTLTEQIIASHPWVHGAGELYDLLETASQSTAVGGQKASFADNFATLNRDHVAAWAASYLAGLHERAPQAKRISDKMPANFFLVGLIHAMLPNAKIIHLNRNPVDTCLSCFTRLFHTGQDHTYDLVELGHYYRRYADIMAHWRAVLPPGSFLDLQYEELVADPESQIPALIEFCGLPWDDACLEPHKHKRSIRTASVTQVRQPVYTSSVERWRRYEKFLTPLVDALGDLVPNR